MWRGPDIAPLAESPEIFLDHINFLVPDKRERDLLLHYLAGWCSKSRIRRCNSRCLIVGKGSTSKSWLSRLLQVLFWRKQRPRTLPRGEKIADKFNAEVANRQAVFVEELLAEL